MRKDKSFEMKERESVEPNLFVKYLLMVRWSEN